MLEPGDKLGAYEIIAPLTSGGMAAMFLARRTGAGGFSRFVAIKACHEHLGEDEAMVKRFLDEARISARVQHPHVVHVEDLLEDGGRYYIVMEYVHGASLSQLVDELTKRRRRMAMEIGVALTCVVADALHAAHEAKDDYGRPLAIVHRDVSPQNILLSADGHVKLIDFGVATADARLYESATGQVVGKLRYISPEQALASGVDRRADLYSLGAVLWELLTMKPLFRGGLEMLDDRPAVRPPGRYVDAVPPALDAVVLATLDEDPSGRPATALELRKRLFEAVPAAREVDSEVLGELVRSVLDEELERVTDALPKELSFEMTLEELATDVMLVPPREETRADLTRPMPIGPAASPAPPPSITQKTAAQAAEPASSRWLGATILCGALVFGVALGLWLGG